MTSVTSSGEIRRSGKPQEREATRFIVRSNISVTTSASPTSAPMTYAASGLTLRIVRGRPPEESSWPPSTTTPSATSSVTMFVTDVGERPVASLASERLDSPARSRWRSRSARFARRTSRTEALRRPGDPFSILFL